MADESQLAADETRDPVTEASLVADLEALGMRAGQTVLVHSSLSRLGWIPGGPQLVISALMRVLGDEGTLAMPAHSTQLTDPRHWQNPPVPERWWPIIRSEGPVFDPHLTPTRAMGAIAELFRNLPGVRRSAHPHGSFAARGPAAGSLLAGHALEDMFGERSPLARLYEQDGYVLLLGVDHSNNTSLHLAENRANLASSVYLTQGAAVVHNGVREWVEFEDLDGDASDFAELGEDFARETGAERRGPAGWGIGRFMRQQAVVDYGIEWLRAHRQAPGQ